MRSLIAVLLLVVPLATAGDEPDACAALDQLAAALHSARMTAWGSYSAAVEARQLAGPALDDLSLTAFHAGRVVERILEARDLLARLRGRLGCSPLA